MEKTVEIEVIETILQLYDFREQVHEQKMYLYGMEEDGRMKLIFRVALESGKILVMKIFHEDEDLAEEREKVERQSAFSELLRSHGIQTPARYQANGKYCNEYVYHDLPCMVTVEDWCGEEITEINTAIAYQIGELMARMHNISLANKCEIGHRTLFSAAYWSDVDAFPEFCEIAKDEQLDQVIVAQIKALREEKLGRIRATWETLPKAAVQGDISINNLVNTENGLIVFDYNNAGDEVLISDLVMEGLLTAYEMDLPEGTPASYRERLFPEFLKGYLSVRHLSEAECVAAWEVYTLYHGLWFTRIIYNEDSLDRLVKNGDYDSANRLLKQMLADMKETDDGRFRGNGMLTKEQYLAAPCKVASIPYWKAKTITVPDSMKILHYEEYNQEEYPQYMDEPYFRLFHNLKGLSKPVLPLMFSLCTAPLSEYATHINSCYDGIGITEAELRSYTTRPVYDAALWLAVKDNYTGKIVATGIAELDREIGEGILEWIQVSEDHRGRELGQYIVSELLWRMKDKADFVTVSGQCNNPSDPERLYRKCGFTGNDVWHILRKV